jgi:hypothetical protein
MLPRVPAEAHGSQDQQGDSQCQRNCPSHQQACGSRHDQVRAESRLHLGIHSKAAVSVHDDDFPAAGGKVPCELLFAGPGGGRAPERLLCRRFGRAGAWYVTVFGPEGPAVHFEQFGVVHARKVTLNVVLRGNPYEDFLARVRGRGAQPQRPDVERQARRDALADGIKPGRGQGVGPNGQAGSA